MTKQTESSSFPQIPLGNRIRKAIAELSTWIGRCIAVGLLAASPWQYGLVEWGAQLWVVYGSAACLACSVLAHTFGKVAHARVAWSPITAGLLGLVLLAALQTVVLPDTIWESIAAGAKWEKHASESAVEIGKSLPQLESGIYSIRFPRTLSLDPLQTRASLCLLAAATSLVLASGPLFRGKGGTIILIVVVSCSTSLFAALGLWREVWGEDSMFGRTAGDVGFSSLVSRNSAPQLLAIGFGSMLGLLAWWHRRRRTAGNADRSDTYSIRYPSVNPVARLRRRIDSAISNLDVVTALIVLGLALHVLAILATASRGGIVGFFSALIISALLPLLVAHKPTELQKGGGFIAVLLAVVVGSVLLVILDIGSRSLAELASINQEAHERSNVRFELWQWSLSEPAYWGTGSGLGTYHFAVLPLYRWTAENWYYHAESIYVEVLTEFGFGGGICVALLLFGCARLIGRLHARKQRNELLFPALTFIFLAVGIQSIADFSVIIPAIYVPLAFLTGALIADGQNSVFVKRKRVDARKLAKGGVNFGSDSQTSGALVADHSQNPSVGLWTSWVAPILAVFGVGIAMWQGLPSLRGYAVADRIARLQPNWNGDSSIWGDVKADVVSFSAAGHPEVRLQMARMQQRAVAHILEQSSKWPVSLAAEERSYFCRPEVVSASMRGGENGPLAEVRVVLEESEAARELLGHSNRVFRDLVDASPLDWRLHWGILRSDVGQLPTTERASVYALLKLTGRHSSQLLESAGLSALWAGENEVGRVLCRSAADHDPTRVLGISRFAALLGKDDILEIIENPLIRAQFVERLSREKGQVAEFEELISSLANSIDLAQSSRLAATEAEWVGLAFVAERTGQLPKAIEFMKQAIIRSPFKPQLKFRLAQLHEQASEIQSAIEVMESVSATVRENVVYRRYLDRLKGL